MPQKDSFILFSLDEQAQIVEAVLISLFLIGLSTQAGGFFVGTLPSSRE